MNELVKLITSKTGLDEKMANQVVELVVGHLKKTLPPPLNTQVDKLLAGQITDVSQIPGLSTGGGGLFSKLFGKK